MTADTDEAAVERLLDLASDLPPRDRAALLDRECRRPARPEGPRRRAAEIRRGGRRGGAPRPAGRPDAPAPPPAAGRFLGRYELLHLIAEGGTGRVYVARHRDMGKRFAVKVLRAELAGQPGARARFHRELRVAGQLDHPNLVAATDASTDGTHYLVTELLDGATVRDLLRAAGQLPVAAACAVAVQALAGLGFLAARGLVHRDVSPSNLFVTRDGVVKLLDFGLVRLGDPGGRPEDWLTGPLAVLGNPAYMAPEQYRSPRSIDPRADLYGLGCVLYHLLAGFPPYHEHGPLDPATLLEKHAAAARPAPVADYRPDVPPPVAALVDGLLARDPAARPGPADHAAAVLRPFAAAPTCRRWWPRPRSGPRSRCPGPPLLRRRRRGLVAAAIGLIVIAGLTIALWPRDRDPDPPPAVVAAGPAAGDARVLRGIEFRYVPAGTFEMGSAPGPGVPANETPARSVTLTRPFWLATDPVTVEQFRAFVEATGYQTSAEQTGQGRRQARGGKWVTDPDVTWRGAGLRPGPDAPGRGPQLGGRDGVLRLADHDGPGARVPPADGGRVGVRLPGRGGVPPPAGPGRDAAGGFARGEPARGAGDARGGVPVGGRRVRPVPGGRRDGPGRGPAAAGRPGGPDAGGPRGRAQLAAAVLPAGGAGAERGGLRVAGDRLPGGGRAGGRLSLPPPSPPRGGGSGRDD